jgi:hypothetical protein
MELKQITKEEYLTRPYGFPNRLFTTNRKYNMVTYEKEGSFFYRFYIYNGVGEVFHYALTFTKKEKPLVLKLYAKNYEFVNFRESIRKHMLLEKLQAV